MEGALALCRSLFMEVFYEFKLRLYCMIINSPYEGIRLLFSRIYYFTRKLIGFNNKLKHLTLIQMLP